MQSLARIFQRGIRTLPDAARVARTESTPIAVRARRAKADPDAATNETDATESGLTPTDRARFVRLQAKGELVRKNGEPVTEAEWIEALESRRSRVRGILGPEGKKRAVGHKVYLPNVIFRLVRNHTAPGQPYNPYEATFRIPQSITKTDVRSYLSSIYGVETTYIRTDNYNAPVKRARDGSWTVTDHHKTYKRAVVGLVKPFYYPQAMEDMDGTARAERQQWLEEKFAVQAIKNLQKSEMLRMTRAGSKGWKWRHGVVAQRGQILRNIMEKRNKRDLAIEQTAESIRSPREAGDVGI
jgi:large subunit ribosomal protein L23